MDGRKTMTTRRIIGCVAVMVVCAAGSARGAGSPWRNSIVAPRAAMRPAGAPSVSATPGTPGKARRPRTGAPAARGLRGGVAISGIFEGGATQPDGMQRRSNADGVAPRAATWTVRPAIASHSGHTRETYLIRMPLSSGDQPQLSHL